MKKENENAVSRNDDAVEEFSTPRSSQNPKFPKIREAQSDIGELRRLLVKPGEVSVVLPEAVRKSSEKDGDLAEATLPIVEDNIRQSAARDPKILAQALYPVIGPAIRKAISQALGAMVQSLNQTLEHSISPKGISWRIEALRTGKSFGEIVMMKTLLYRVEQVFLIHKKTGLLLEHVTADESEKQDADMVSAMLTAIQDFAQDSFNASEDATLDSLKIEELSVWIEHSPDALVAGVIRGTPPLSLRETFSQAAEEIQFYQEADLKNFDGNADVFERSRPVLERCLQFQAGEQKETSGVFKPMNIVAAGLLGLLFIFGFFYVRDYYRWSGFVERLESEKGILVTETDRGFFTHSISGLRDPLAVDPVGLTEEYGYDSEDVEQNWKTYYDANSEFIVKRAELLLKPPRGVKLSFANGVLSAEGNAPVGWLSDAAKIAAALIGVNEFRAKDGVADGLKNKIESTVVMFNCNTDDFAKDQTTKIETLVKDLESFAALGNGANISVHGHTTKIGSEEENNSLSDSRAEKVKSEILGRSSKLRDMNNTGTVSFKTVRIEADKETEECAATLTLNADSE
ncbi:MAG: OmpA family protein [Pyrinomonadaceae bacterium]|nr:OmpA family protein [Pyrinomonadaceae bacterium]